MKLLDILSSAGTAAVKAFVPGGGLIIDVINGFLPEDAQLPIDATGTAAQSAIDGLPAEQRAQLLAREFDVQHHTLQAMLLAEQTSTQTTRPKIALGAFRLVAFVSAVAVALWAYAVASGDAEMVSVVADGWPFVAAVVGPFVTLLWAYFGVLKTEQRDRLNAAGGATGGVLSGLISNIIKK